MKYCIFEKKSGKIFMLGVGETSLETLKSKYGEDFGVIEGHFKEKYYIIDETPLLRPDNPSIIDKIFVLADQIDTVIISNIPVNAEVFISGTGSSPQRYSVDDGTIEFSTRKAGTHSIKILAFPFLDKEFLINAN